MYSVKNIKSWNSQEYGENGAFSCTVYRDKKRVAKFTEWGDGAPCVIEWLDSVKNGLVLNIKDYKGDPFERRVTIEENKMIEFLKGKTYDFDGESLPMDEELFIPRLVEQFEKERAERLWDNKVKRWCKTKTVAVMKDAKDGGVVSWNTPFTPRFKEVLVEKFGDDIVEFVNERYA